METLKKGTGQKGWSVVTTCSGRGNGDGGCGAQLRVDEDDLFRTESHARDETTEYTTFRCQECGTLTDLQKVPSNVSRNLPYVSKWCEARGLTWKDGKITPIPGA